VTSRQTVCSEPPGAGDHRERHETWHEPVVS
jgi:hypothetical protein